MHLAMKRIWDLMPRVLQDSIAVTVDGFAKRTVPAPPQVPHGVELAMFIGPTNYAGQATRWSRALEGNPLIAARSMVCAETNGFGYPADYSVRWRTMTHSRAWQRNLLGVLASQYTHVVFEAAMPVLGGMFGGSIRRQVGALREAGLVVGMVAHGTDARLPSRHRSLEPWSCFANDDWVPVDLFEKEIKSNLELLQEIGAPTFVSTAGLLLDVPGAHLLPVVIEPGRWANAEQILIRERIRIVHAPSNPQPKGTHLIEPVLHRLEQEGLIEYVRLENRAHSDMPAMFASADILLDQFRVGDYGVAACEAMAGGRLVVSHVSEQVRAAVLDSTARELPIIEATIDSLEQTLRDIHENRPRYRKIAAQGPMFVQDVHDGRLSRTVLERNFLFS